MTISKIGQISNIICMTVCIIGRTISIKDMTIGMISNITNKNNYNKP
jgi:hypothetical protein